MTELHLFAFSNIFPELILACSSLALTILGLFISKAFERTKAIFILVLITIVGAIFFVSSEHSSSFNGLFTNSKYIALSKYIVLASAFFSTLLCMSNVKLNSIYYKFELPILILLSTLGMMLILSSNNFMSLYLGLEMQSICLYILVSFDRSNLKCSEGGLKYFILTAVASSIMLYGISLIYGFSGTLGFEYYATLLVNGAAKSALPAGAIIGLVLVIAGFCFKVAAAPFHVWAPDVYQGAGSPITSFLITTSKATIMLFMVRLLREHFFIWKEFWAYILQAVCILSLFVGALGALKQTDIKRLLAYSSINHVGFVILGIISFHTTDISSVTIYVCIYIVMNVGLFAFIQLLQKQGESEQSDLGIFSGLGSKNPMLALCITILLLSMAGIPPLAGFLAKFYIINTALQSKLYIASICAMLSAVIATFYYLKIIRMMYFDYDTTISYRRAYTIENIGIGFSATLFNVLLILWPSALSNFL